MTLSRRGSFLELLLLPLPGLLSSSLRHFGLGWQLLADPAIDAAVGTADSELSLQPRFELAVTAPAVGVAQFLLPCLPNLGRQLARSP